jgi:cellulose biosynthesis protein BcsQ
MSAEAPATTLALFNHKGGVSKTTTSFNLGWKLAEKGHTVVLVDADPQCNLTGMVSGYTGMTDLEKFYGGTTDAGTIYSGLRPAFEAQPREIEAVPLVAVAGRPGLHLLPGDIRLAEYETTLGIAQELSGAIQALKNLPGSLRYLIDKSAKSVGADFVILDMSPGLGPVNQNLVSTSDFVIIPAAPDFFSVMAIDSLARVLPRWNQWAKQAASLPILAEASYPFPKPNMKVLGTIVQKYRPRTGQPAAAFQRWIDEIGVVVKDRLVPALEEADLLAAPEVYSASGVSAGDLCLAQIPEFNSLIAKSQDTLTPVFALSEEQLGGGGSVLENWIISRDSFNRQFEELTDRIVEMIDAAKA